MYKYIIEFKFAVGVEDDVTVQEALEIAAQNCEIVYNFKPTIWFATISKFDNNSDIEKKYFYNPHSSTFLEVE